MVRILAGSLAFSPTFSRAGCHLSIPLVAIARRWGGFGWATALGSGIVLSGPRGILAALLHGGDVEPGFWMGSAFIPFAGAFALAFRLTVRRLAPEAVL